MNKMKPKYVNSTEQDAQIRFQTWFYNLITILLIFTYTTDGLCIHRILVFTELSFRIKQYYMNS